ncbi:hypothetical protein DFH09DRAFT_1094774 [Mycena vulgaris]|nr:hypothetical protein DFH09DRAFT_1094774 [Mycena vulgaris]
MPKLADASTGSGETLSMVSKPKYYAAGTCSRHARRLSEILIRAFGTAIGSGADAADEARMDETRMEEMVSERERSTSQAARASDWDKYLVVTVARTARLSSSSSTTSSSRPSSGSSSSLCPPLLARGGGRRHLGCPRHIDNAATPSTDLTDRDLGHMCGHHDPAYRVVHACNFKTSQNLSCGRTELKFGKNCTALSRT